MSLMIKERKPHIELAFGQNISIMVKLDLLATIFLIKFMAVALQCLASTLIAIRQENGYTIMTMDR